MHIFTMNYSYKGKEHVITVGEKAMTAIDLNQVIDDSVAQIGVAKQLLVSSTLLCYCSSLIVALDSRKVEYSEITAEAKGELGNNSTGQGRLQKIQILVNVKLQNPEQQAVFERIQKIMKNGCLVTGSLHDGVHMDYDLTAK